MYAWKNSLKQVRLRNINIVLLYKGPTSLTECVNVHYSIDSDPLSTVTTERSWRVPEMAEWETYSYCKGPTFPTQQHKIASIEYFCKLRRCVILCTALHEYCLTNSQIYNLINIILWSLSDLYNLIIIILWSLHRVTVKRSRAWGAV